MIITCVDTVVDSSGLTVAIYRAEHADESPDEVKHYQSFCFRDIPQGTLVLSLDFAIEHQLLQARIATMTGNTIDRPAFTLGPGQTITMQELLHLAKEAALAAQLTAANNQDVRMLLGQPAYELPQQGLFWSNAASLERARRRLWQKTNLSRLRLITHFPTRF